MRHTRRTIFSKRRSVFSCDTYALSCPGEFFSSDRLASLSKHRVKNKIYRITYCVSSLIESLGQAYVQPGFICGGNVATSYTRNQIGTEVAATDTHMIKQWCHFRSETWEVFRVNSSVVCTVSRYKVVVFSPLRL